METKQRTLENFDEADELDTLNSKFFKPLENLSYVLTFSKNSEEKAYSLIEKEMPDYNEPTKMVPKVILTLNVDSINGKRVSQTWDIFSPVLRKMVAPHCTSGNLLLKKWQFKAMGKGTQRNYVFAEVGAR
jgi:hypothetical protein